MPNQDFETFRQSVITSENPSTIIQVVSFDVFDTLLKRSFLNQENTWKAVSHQFYTFRRLAEIIARRLNPKFRSQEVTLSDIYRFMPKLFLSDSEFSFEKKSIRIDSLIDSLITYLLEKNIEVFLVSDTYYSSRQIYSLLEGVSFDRDKIKIICSSEFGCTKSQKLFSIIKNNFSLNYTYWTHIGDNLEADYQIPNKLGIKCFLYENSINAFLKSKVLSKKGINKWIVYRGPQNLYEFIDEFQDFSSNSAVSILDSLSTQLLSPIIKTLVLQIDRSERERNSQLLLYASRDGWLLYKYHRAILKKLNSPFRIEYFKTSRKLRENIDYGKYLISLLRDYKTVGLYDLGWKGSTLKHLQMAFPSINFKGYFFTSSYSGKAEFLNLFPFSKIQKISIFRAREFFELLFPAPTGSFTDLNSDDYPISGNFIQSDKVFDVNRFIKNIEAQYTLTDRIHPNNAVFALYLLAAYPGDSLIAIFNNFKFESLNNSPIYLVTNSWKRLFSRQKILWPFAARIQSKRSLQFVFRVCCLLKELCQKLPKLNKIFIG